MIDYYCPPYSEFDTILKVCKLSETADPDAEDESCNLDTRTAAPPLRPAEKRPLKPSYDRVLERQSTYNYYLTTAMPLESGPVSQKLIFQGDRYDNRYFRAPEKTAHQPSYEDPSRKVSSRLGNLYLQSQYRPIRADFMGSGPVVSLVLSLSAKRYGM